MAGRSMWGTAIVAIVVAGMPWHALAAPLAEADFREALADAARELEIAQLKLRSYDNYEFPLSLRRLESQIKLNAAELSSWRRRVREYEQFDKFVGSAPVLLTLEEARLAVLRLETSIDDLQQEKDLLDRSRSDQRRLYKLQVEAAARRLAEVRKLARAATR